MYRKLSQVILLVFVAVNMCQSDDYMKYRQDVIQEEERWFTGDGLNLTDQELRVNEHLVNLKMAELEQSYHNSSMFLPARNFLDAKQDIDKSQVYQFIKEVPKGASLHTHMLAGVDVDYVIKNFTYNDNVYGCYNSLNIFKLRVLKDPKDDANCTWKSLKDYRKESSNFDQFLRDHLALPTSSTSLNKENVWIKFKNTFSSLYDLVAYRPFFQKYIYQLLLELYRDKVFYTELRGTFMPLYELNGTTYDPGDFLKILIDTVEEFKKDYPDFLGVKYIHSIYRGVDNSTLKAGLDELLKYKQLYSDFVAGFDFVGLEDDGHNLVDFHQTLQDVAKKDLKFFFHAGETNQYGRTDLNLVDAILLNSSRIGHGFALAKHPKLMEIGQNKGIAVELCPISNQVLKLNSDPRNHPTTVLLAQSYPVVVCNDDPSVWNATGLSYDWYVTFMSMTWERDGLKVLKQLALNSIIYSAMSEKEKEYALQKWHIKWEQFIQKMDKIPASVSIV